MNIEMFVFLTVGWLILNITEIVFIIIKNIVYLIIFISILHYKYNSSNNMKKKINRRRKRRDNIEM